MFIPLIGEEEVVEIIAAWKRSSGNGAAAVFGALSIAEGGVILRFYYIYDILNMFLFTNWYGPAHFPSTEAR